MELLDFLNKSIQERFIANSTVEAIEAKIKKDIERKIFRIYESKKIHYENLEFELIGVKARYSTYSDTITFDNKISVDLDYICVSKLQKDKQQKVEEARKKYEESRYFGWNNLKVQLWHSLHYSLDLKTCLESEDIRLSVVFS